MGFFLQNQSTESILMHALFSWQQKHALLYKILIWTFPYDFLYSWDWIMTQPHRLILNSDGVALIDCHKHHDIVNREIFALVLFRPRWEQFNLRLNGLSFLILVLSLSLLNATVSWRTQESVKLHVCKCRRIKKIWAKITLHWVGYIKRILFERHLFS